MIAFSLFSSSRNEPYSFYIDGEEFYRDVENNISDYVLFFAKVRKGEVWNKEMGKAAVNKAVESLKNLSYKQV